MPALYLKTETALELFALTLPPFSLDLKWFLRKKSWWTISWNFPWMFPTNPCFENYNKKDESPCLLKRYNAPILPHRCLYWYTNHVRFSPRLRVHFANSWTKGFLKQHLKKHLIGRRSRAYEKLSHIVYGKITHLKWRWLNTFLESLFSRS